MNMNSQMMMLNNPNLMQAAVQNAVQMGQYNFQMDDQESVNQQQQ